MLDRRFDRFPSMKRRALELEGGRVTMPAIDPDLCTVIRCAYCGRFALDPPEAPPATDREGWAFLAGQHWPECPWVQTRAWSLSLRMTSGRPRRSSASPARAYGGRGIRGGGFSVYDPPPHSIQ